jgi:hypothetical protein
MTSLVNTVVAIVAATLIAVLLTSAAVGITLALLL